MSQAIGILCVAHTLNLSVFGVVHDRIYISDLGSVLINPYKFYQNTPMKKRATAKS